MKNIIESFIGLIASYGHSLAELWFTDGAADVYEAAFIQTFQKS